MLMCTTPLMAAYSPPVGIPAPAWGIDEIMPSRPNPWTSDTAGYYYVDYTSGTDSGRTWGNPTAPRKTIPATIAAGAYLELNGNYGADLLTASGTGDNWSANSAGPVWITCSGGSKENCTLTGTLQCYGSYVYLDNATSTSKIQFGTTTDGAQYNVDHMMIRNSNIYGDGTDLVKGGISILASDNATPVQTASNVIIYNNTVHDFGNMENDNDTDTGMVFVGNGAVSYVWMLENTVYNMSNTAMFAGGQTESPSDMVNHIYFGKNHIYNSVGGGMAVKCSNNVVMSENNIHDIIPAAWTNGKCIGAQYNYNNLWILNNTCYHSAWGIKFGGSEGDENNAFIIGNLLYDIKWTYHCEVVGGSYCRIDGVEGDHDYPRSVYDEAAMGLWSGDNLYIVNNTIYDSSSGIFVVGGANLYIENNIIAPNSDSNPANTNIQAWFLNPAGTIVMKNNDLYQASGTWVVRWGASTDYTSLADLYAARGLCDPNAGGCISSDPAFVNAASYGDLSLGSSSPCIGAGLDASDLSDVGDSTDVYDYFSDTFSLDIKKDIAGTTRPQQTTWDIGAYEYTPSTPGQVTGSFGGNLR